MSAETPRRRNLWPLGIVGLLLTVVVANVVLLVVANSSPPLLESEDAYAAGLAHDTVIAERAAASNLGWRAELSSAAAHIEWRLLDRAGAPVRRLVGATRLSRADTEAHDVELGLEEIAPGVYRARWSGAPGLYRVETRLTRDAETWVDARRIRLP